MLEDYLEKVLEQTNEHIDRSMDTSIEVDMTETKNRMRMMLMLMWVEVMVVQQQMLLVQHWTLIRRHTKCFVAG